MKKRAEIDPAVLAMRKQILRKYRNEGYGKLSSHIKKPEGASANLKLIDIEADDGQYYQIEVQAFWDDRPDEDIRVSADILTLPLRPLFGFIPIYIGGDSDDFIIRPDGTFVDE